MVLIFGKGVLGKALASRDRRAHVVSREEADITNIADIYAAIEKYQPAAICNAAAYTSVDGCESNIVADDGMTGTERAYAVNAVGAGKVALAASVHGLPLIHISTDYVFNGNSGPYTDVETPYPVQHYGRSKHLGEVAVRAYHPEALIIRVGWLYGLDYPNKAPMLALTETYTQRVRIGNVHTNASKRVHLWDDMRGTPTYLPDLAELIVAYGHSPSWYGRTVHAAEEGMKPVSWYEFLRPKFGDMVRPSKSQGRARRPMRGGLVASEGWALRTNGLGRFLVDADRAGV